MFHLKLERFSLAYKLVVLVAATVMLATGPIVFLSYRDSGEFSIESTKAAFANVSRSVSENALQYFMHTQEKYSQQGQSMAHDAVYLVEQQINCFKRNNPVEMNLFFKTSWEGVSGGIYRKKNGTEVIAHKSVRSLLAQDSIDNHGRHLSYYLSKDVLPYITEDIVSVVDLQTRSGFIRPHFFVLRPFDDKLGILFYEIPGMDEELARARRLQYENISNVVYAIPSLPDKALLSVVEAAGKDRQSVIVSRQDDKDVSFPELPDQIYQKAKEEGTIFDMTSTKDGEFMYCIEYIPILDWHIVSMMPYQVVRNIAMDHVIKLLWSMFAVFCIAVAVGIYGLTRIMRPLNAIFKVAKRLMHLDFTSEVEVNQMQESVVELPPSKGDEIGRLSETFRSMVDALVKGLSLLRQTLTKQNKLEGELDAAHNIQMSLLSSDDAVTTRPGFNARTRITPAREVGGDFFDIIDTPDGREAVVMGDVSGKGVSAALFMCVALTLARGAIAGGLDPDEVLKTVNDGLAARNPSCMFATLWVGFFDPKTGRLDFSNGGHCAPAVLSKEGNVRWIDAVSGMMVGPMTDSQYTMETTQLEPGDTCLLYTDGVSEAMNAEHELFGAERIEATLRSLPESTPEAVLAGMMDAIMGHRKDYEQSDDIAMLAFHYDSIKEVL